MVLALVLKDHVHLLGAGSANVRSEHDVVRRFSMHVSLVELAVEKLDVAATAVDVLLVLYGELDHQRFVHIGDWGEGSAHAIKPCVLARPSSLVQLLITIELASFQGENTSFSPLVGGLDPGIEGVELLLKENFRESDSPM